MKVLATLWGLIVDDGRLAYTLGLFIIIGATLSYFQQPWIAAIVIWLGLLVSLWVSVIHQLNKKQGIDKGQG